MMPSAFGVNRQDICWSCGTEGFFRGLCAQARSDFESLARYITCPAGTVLIDEEQEPTRILFLLEGEVNVSMNSYDGRRLILEVAGAGDTIGLASAVSGDASDIRAEARFPCRIAWLPLDDFHAFLVRHPIASKNVSRELSLQHTRACKRLRILGLTSSAMAKLAHLLLEWSRVGPRTRDGVRIRFVLTHEEIGECIGISRETVSRTLSDFKDHDLVKLCGPALIIRSRRALEIYVGINSMPGRKRSAA